MCYLGVWKEALHGVALLCVSAAQSRLGTPKFTSHSAAQMCPGFVAARVRLVQLVRSCCSFSGFGGAIKHVLNNSSALTSKHWL